MKSEINSPYAPYIDPNRFGKPDLSRLLIFDTTLRDGEQTSGAAQGPDEKAYLSKFIFDVGVDAMEVSFAISDPKEITATHKVIDTLKQGESAKSIRDVVIYSLSRAYLSDVDAAWEAVKAARIPGIHTFISTSEEHRIAKFPEIPREDLKKRLAESAAYAAQKISSSGRYGMVEVSTEDAVRTPIDFIVEVYSHVMNAIKPYFGKVGFTFNIPDTVGVVVHPKKYLEYIKRLRNDVDGIEKVLLSAHIHNDHGLAVATSMLSTEEGVRQIEATINGIGERAGNSSLEQIAMIVEHDVEGGYGIRTGINPKMIYPASVVVAAFTGFHPSRNQPVVGINAITHEAGIHQHGQIKGKELGRLHVYEGVTGDEIGAGDSRFTLGRRSGAHALDYHLTLLGYNLIRNSDGTWNKEERGKVYERFIEFASDQRTVTHRELKDLMMVLGYITNTPLPVNNHPS